MNIFVPPELNNVEEDLRRFFDAMVFKLRKNAYKGRWEDLDINDAIERLHDETKELGKAIIEGNSTEIMLECADVANFALILANIAIEGRNNGPK